MKRLILLCATVIGGCHGIDHDTNYPGGKFERHASAGTVSTKEHSSYYQACLEKNEGISDVEAKCQHDATVWSPGDPIQVYLPYYGIYR